MGCSGVCILCPQKHACVYLLTTRAKHVMQMCMQVCTRMHAVCMWWSCAPQDALVARRRVCRGCTTRPPVAPCRPCVTPYHYSGLFYVSLQKVAPAFWALFFQDSRVPSAFWTQKGETAKRAQNRPFRGCHQMGVWCAEVATLTYNHGTSWDTPPPGCIPSPGGSRMGPDGRARNGLFIKRVISGRPGW